MIALLPILLSSVLLGAPNLEQQLELCRQAVAGAENEAEYDPAPCEMAAELGSPHANYVLGMYYDRKGDREKSGEHYQQAVARGFIWGHIGLGHLNIVQDPEQAERHYRIVAESTDETAIVPLAFIGDLRVRADEHQKAYSWFYACAYFDTYAQEFCQRKLQGQEEILTNEKVQLAIRDARPIIEWFSDNKALNADAGKAGAG